jgi:hypothetical protein
VFDVEASGETRDVVEEATINAEDCRGKPLHLLNIRRDQPIQRVCASNEFSCTPSAVESGKYCDQLSPGKKLRFTTLNYVTHYVMASF